MAEAPTADPTNDIATPAPDAPTELDAALSEMAARLFKPDETPQETPAATPEDEDDEDEATPSTPAQAEEPETPEDGASDEPADQPAPQYTSRRAAAKAAEKLAKDLDDLSRQHEDLKQRHTAQETLANQSLSTFESLTLPEAEYRALQRQAINGDADARDKLTIADFWRQAAAPVYERARREATQTYWDLTPLRALDGVDEATYQSVKNAPSFADAVKAVHAAAAKAAAAKETAKVRKLEAEIASLRTRQTTNGVQPAAGGGGRATRNGLDALLGPDGLPTDEAERLSEAELRARLGG